MASERLAERDAAVGALGGSLLVAHALASPFATARIVDGGWGVSELSPATAALAVRLFETVALLLVAVGVGALVDRYDVSTGSRAWEGALVALTGLATTLTFYWCLHLLAGPTLPGTDVALLALGYYLGWTLTNAGLFLCGASTLGDDRSGAVPVLLVLPLPLAAGLGALVAVSDVASVAVAHRLVAGATWVLVGGTLWRSERRSTADRARRATGDRERRATGDRERRATGDREHSEPRRGDAP